LEFYNGQIPWNELSRFDDTEMKAPKTASSEPLLSWLSFPFVGRYVSNSGSSLLREFIHQSTFKRKYKVLKSKATLAICRALESWPILKVVLKEFKNRTPACLIVCACDHQGGGRLPLRW